MEKTKHSNNSERQQRNEWPKRFKKGMKLLHTHTHTSQTVSKIAKREKKINIIKSGTMNERRSVRASVSVLILSLARVYLFGRVLTQNNLKSKEKISFFFKSTYDHCLAFFVHFWNIIKHASFWHCWRRRRRRCHRCWASSCSTIKAHSLTVCFKLNHIMAQCCDCCDSPRLYTEWSLYTVRPAQIQTRTQIHSFSHSLAYQLRKREREREMENKQAQSFQSNDVMPYFSTHERIALH